MSRRAAFPLLMLLMAAIYVAYAALMPIVYPPDTNTYILPARSLLEGNYDTIYRVPVYPLFLAALFSAGLDTADVIVVQHVIAWLSIAVMYWIARKPLGRRCALFCAFIYGISPVWLYLQHMIFSEALFVPLSVLVLAVALRGGMAEGRLPGTALLALLMMLAALTRPIYVAFIACVPGLFLLYGHVPLRRALAHAALFCTVCAALLTPWLIRQSIESTDAFTPIAARNLPINTVMLLDPSTPVSDPRVKRWALERFLIMRYPQDGWALWERNNAMMDLFNELGRELNISETQVNRAVTVLALECIADKPLGYLWVVLKNFATLMLTLPIMIVLFSLPMALAFRRRGRPRLQRQQWLLLAAHVLVLAAVTALFEEGLPRYTLTFWPALCLLFAAAVQQSVGGAGADRPEADKSGRA